MEAGVETIYKTSGDANLIKLERTKRKDGPAEDFHQLKIHPVQFTDSCVLMPTRADTRADTGGHDKAAIREQVTKILGDPMHREKGLSQNALRDRVQVKKAVLGEVLAWMQDRKVITPTPHRLIVEPVQIKMGL